MADLVRKIVKNAVQLVPILIDEEEKAFEIPRNSHILYKNPRNWGRH
jgi:hypothetical protein